MNSPTPPVEDVLTRLRLQTDFHQQKREANSEAMCRDAAKVVEVLRTDLQKAKEALEAIRVRHGWCPETHGCKACAKASAALAHNSAESR